MDDNGFTSAFRLLLRCSFQYVDEVLAAGRQEITALLGIWSEAVHRACRLTRNRRQIGRNIKRHDMKINLAKLLVENILR